MAMRQDYDHMLKVLLIGDSGVGKTSLLLSFTSEEFVDDQKATIGVDLKMKMVNVRGQRLKLTLWDTAGQERFRTLTSAYYRGAHGVILVFDVCRIETFENARAWLEEYEVYSTFKDAVVMLVANKIDKSAERVISKEQGRQFARENSMLYVETSAKTREGVERAFDELVHKILDFPSLLEEKQTLKVESGSGQDPDIGMCSYCLI